MKISVSNLERESRTGKGGAAIPRTELMRQHPRRMPPRFCSFGLVFVAMLASRDLAGQSTVVPAPLTQSYTPPALAPGTPAGSYILSGFDTINYGNLSVNFRFPLVKIGGRGTASAVMMPDFTPYSQWTVTPAPIYANCGPNGCTLTGWQYGIKNNSAWSGVIPPIYGVPRIMLREAGYLCVPGTGLLQNYSQSTLSRITFIGSDGTEMELIDQKSGGQPQPYNLGQGSAYYDRGAVWVTRDGTSAVFTTPPGQNVTDTVARAANCSSAPLPINGTLVMRDGTTYTFANTVAKGYATSITDRNGNTINYLFDGSGNLTGITDSVGRSYGIKQGLVDSILGRSYDQLTYTGGNDAVRSINIHHDVLANILRKDQSIKTDDALWPKILNLNSGQTPSPIGGTFISEIDLPDGSSYIFKYDSYGNVARIQLPAGGAVEYDWAGQQTVGPWGGFPAAESFFLRCVLTKRREYLHSTDTTPSRETIYSAPGAAVTVSDYDGSGTILQSKTVHNVVAGAWPPLNVPIGYDSPSVGQEPSTQYYDSDGVTLLRSISRTYQERSCAGDSTCWWLTNTDSYGRPPHDYLPWQESTTEGALTKQTVSLYDQYNNEDNRTESDWGSGPSGGPVLRQVVTTFNTGSSYVAGNILNLPTEVELLDGSGNKWADTTYSYDDPNSLYGYTAVGGGYVAPPANTSTAGQSATWQYDYNTGKVTQATDVNKVNTIYSFADNLDRLTQIRRAAGITIAGTLVETQTNVVYSPGGTVPLSVDLYNDQSATGDRLLRTRTVYDGFGRDAENDQYVDTSGDYIQTLKTYDALGRLSTTSTPAVPGSASSQSWLTTYYPYDGLGRIKTVTTNADNATTNTTYSGNQTTVNDQAGKQRSTWTDGLGRLVQAEEAPGSDNFYTTYGYDALDDLTCVNQGVVGAATANPQIYGCQLGLAHSRSFAYDGLKRLTSATNPESGTIRYAYDGVGNLVSKTDALSVITCYGTVSGSTCNSGYDGLNRPTVKSYSDGKTPQVSYVYDSGSVPYSIGRLTQISNSAATTNYTAYDPLGRVTSSSQVMGGNTYNFPGYQYNQAGALLSETYPSGRIITTGYDGANRPAWLQGSYSGTQSYYIGNQTQAANALTRINYWPSGEPWYFTRGNNVAHAASLNGRLQVVESYESIGNQDTAATMLFMSCPGWGFSNNSNYGTYNDCPQGTAATQTATDNGNLVAYDEYLGGPGFTAKTHFSQSFLYDNENRLTSASDSGGWSQSFAYDQWGNMAVTTPASSAVPMLNVNTAVSTAQYNANNQRTDQTYDANGNLQSLQPSISLTYDAENRQLTAGAYSYTYDGSGHRVTKTGGGATINYVYDAAGQLAAEYSTVANTSPCTTCYLSYDHLGTVRLVTDQNANVVSRHDYLPFGEEIMNAAGRTTALGFGVPDDVSQRFTGKERDVESGLDYFGARYYGSGMGRFTSPDSPSYANRMNPQTWNLYAYGLNNPLIFVDPDGHEIVCANNASQCQKDAAAATGSAEAAKRVTTATTKTDHSFLGLHWTTSKTTIAISGDMKSFRALGSNASRLADMVADTHNSVTVTYDNSAKPSFWSNGYSLPVVASTSFTPSQGYDPQAFIDPNRKTGVEYDPDAVEQHLPQATTGEEFGHEVLGHIWGELYGHDPAGTQRNMRDSISGENAVRALDPARGQKGATSHHNYDEVPK